jgi:hypothetical protein
MKTKMKKIRKNKLKRVVWTFRSNSRLCPHKNQECMKLSALQIFHLIREMLSGNLTILHAAYFPSTWPKHSGEFATNYKSHFRNSPEINFGQKHEKEITHSL